jgi:hypothetical protein
MLEGVEPDGTLSAPEAASLFASWINEVAYASIETPRVHEDHADFDIHYCPHEDVYGAFDCRVQRYFVQGMLDAARGFFGDRGLDVEFRSTIPSGSPTCHFEIFPKRAAEDDAWSGYSDRLRDRALKRARDVATK